MQQHPDLSADLPHDLRLRLLNDWQHGFPLTPEPFAFMAEALGVSEPLVLRACAQAVAQGVISRIGGVFSHGAGGDALLAAMAVPVERLDEVAAMVSASPGVNHNYAREHRVNLWFVMTGPDREQVEHHLQALECDTGLPIMRLRMVRPYRIDLGFDLRYAVARHPMRAGLCTSAQPLQASDWPLASLLEEGLPVISRPFARWAEQLQTSESAVIGTLADWLASGRLKRLGVVVRHHELGFGANAMTVFDVPDEQVDVCGQVLAAQPGVTLAYRRTRDAAWPFNLYAMVHGTRRDVVLAVVDRITHAAGLDLYPRQVLFSTTRYKQTGGRRFRAQRSTEAAHALAG